MGADGARGASPLPDEQLDAPDLRLFVFMLFFVFGGAIIPSLTGYAADRIGLHLSLMLPAACYVLIAGFGVYAASERGLARKAEA